MTVMELLTARAKAVWSAGDWPELSRLLEDVSRTAVDRLDVGPGHELLDVAMGTGTAAIHAAKRGATVTGLDFVPAQVAAAKERARSEGVEGTWVEGDAQALPFGDASFDRVVSCFGVMFAPDQERAAAELVRVCRPGGAIAVAAWTPEGHNGRISRALGAYLPPPPDGFRPPVLWGSEERVRELFAGHGIETERLMCRFEHDDFDAYNEDVMAKLGPMVTARAALEPEGRWEAAREDILAVMRDLNQRSDGGLSVDAEYLLTIVRPA